ncbi:MAG: hypothetical protein ABI604_20395 [Nitrospirota bacterium]
MVEKPIGYDLGSARALNAILAANFEESQIFRIDHYFGKERCKTFWLSVLPIHSSSRSGTGGVWSL